MVLAPSQTLSTNKLTCAPHENPIEVEVDFLVVNAQPAPVRTYQVSTSSSHPDVVNTGKARYAFRIAQIAYTRVDPRHGPHNAHPAEICQHGATSRPRYKHL